MKSSKSVALLTIIACQLMIVLDASIMITALPEIGRTLQLSTTTLTWVQNAYILAFGGLLLLGARAGDIFGRKNVFMIGIALFSVASLLVGLANSTEFLLISRSLQGVAAALATPSTLALLSVIFVEQKERAKAIALYSAISGIGGSVGLVLGGLLTDLISWRVGMFINVPIGMILLLLAPKYLPHTEKVSGRFDFVGAFTSVVGMTALVYGFIQAADKGWGNLVTIISLMIGIVLVISFVFIESRAKQPITPLRLFINRERTAGYLGRFLFVGGMFSMIYFLSQFLQIVCGFNSFQAGLAFVPMTAVQFAMMYVVPKLLAKFGTSKLLISGIFVAIVGMSWLSRISLETNFYIGILIPMVILGIGAGIVFIPFTTLGLSKVEPGDAGAASGIVNVAHQIGGSVGLAILATVFGAYNSSGNASKIEFANAISATITGSAFLFVASLAAVTILLLLRSRNPELHKMPA
ncbi:EmrB/QacA subfamily drug resistance transporter [Paenibacillus sp. V4I9]|uniref:MFS transporter n=1 Tax=unclassified Paenibacillus TaxID=185978 RepID=UPI00278B67B8|nr:MULTISPECIES: MFS transporter [unclassified Paenibacillus]MDQ0888557.1 EmrB/QacA subfamily drug resistance transporter [Paenibacillus sp. V4I9]MDQ0896390.1 EmrB/QacA subfamily drug resistance transporter [Paenibacillus sp. V4I7]MDQ0914066.1 EmrB/QacA subfamily drug resistance transporter [Paenibacillus sp. V4I5]